MCRRYPQAFFSGRRIYIILNNGIILSSYRYLHFTGAAVKKRPRTRMGKTSRMCSGEPEPSVARRTSATECVLSIRSATVPVSRRRLGTRNSPNRCRIAAAGKRSAPATNFTGPTATAEERIAIAHVRRAAACRAFAAALPIIR